MGGVGHDLYPAILENRHSISNFLIAAINNYSAFDVKKFNSDNNYLK